MRVLSNRTFQASPAGYDQMLVWVTKHRKAGTELRMVMEATGVYYEDAAYFLRENGLWLSLLLPNRSSAFAKSLSNKSKTDKIDAQMLGQLALERNLPMWEPPGETMLKIKRLCRERIGLLDQKTAVSNRSHARAFSHKPNANSHNRDLESLAFIEKQVLAVEKEIKATIKEDPVLQRKFDKICKIPVVGITTAVTVVAEANGFALFKNKAQLVSYAGYDVVRNESGTSIKSPTKMSKKGNSHIRKALYFPAIVAVKWCPEMKKIFNRMFEKHFVKMKAYVGIQRKLLVLIYTIFKSETDFDPNFKSPKAPK